MAIQNEPESVATRFDMETSKEGLGAIKTLLQGQTSGGIVKQIGCTARHLGKDFFESTRSQQQPRPG